MRWMIVIFLWTPAFGDLLGVKDLAKARSEQELDHILATRAWNNQLQSLCHRQIETSSFPKACYQPQIWRNLDPLQKGRAEGLCHLIVRQDMEPEKIRQWLEIQSLPDRCRKDLNQFLQRRLYQREEIEERSTNTAAGQ